MMFIRLREMVVENQPAAQIADDAAQLGQVRLHPVGPGSAPGEDVLARLHQAAKGRGDGGHLAGTAATTPAA